MSDQPVEISDYSLKYLILGALRATIFFKGFPIMVDHVEENYDENGDVESFSIITASGLKYTVSVEFEP